MNDKDKIKLSVAKLAQITGDTTFDGKYIVIVQNTATGEILTQIFDDEKTANNNFYFVGNVLRL